MYVTEEANASLSTSGDCPPTTASGSKMYPACATEEYASSRMMFVWDKATTLPSVIVSTQRMANPGAHTFVWCPNATNMICSSPAKPAALDATERKAATGIGEPSYVSGAQKWK